MEAIKIISLNNKNKIKFVFVGKFDEDNPSSINKNDFIKFVNNYNIEYLPFLRILLIFITNLMH